MQEACPNSQRKRFGKDRQKYVVGIEPVQELQEAQPDEQTIHTAESLRADNERLRLQVQPLQAQVRKPTEQNHLSSSDHVRILSITPRRENSGKWGSRGIYGRNIISTTAAHTTPSISIVRRIYGMSIPRCTPDPHSSCLSCPAQ